MIEAVPTVTPISVAICGSSESAARTIAWLEKPASASNAIAARWHRGRRRGRNHGRRLESLTETDMRGFVARQSAGNEREMIDKTYQPAEVEGRI